MTKAIDHFNEKIRNLLDENFDLRESIKKQHSDIMELVKDLEAIKINKIFDKIKSIEASEELAISNGKRKCNFEDLVLEVIEYDDMDTYPNLTESANLQDKINYVQPAEVVGKAYDPPGITSQVFVNLNKTPKVTNYSGNTNGTSRNYHHLGDNKIKRFFEPISSKETHLQTRINNEEAQVTTVIQIQTILEVMIDHAVCDTATFENIKMCSVWADDLNVGDRLPIMIEI